MPRFLQSMVADAEGKAADLINWLMLHLGMISAVSIKYRVRFS